MISKQLGLVVEQKLSDFTNNNCKLLSIKHISGGCINQAAKLETSTGNYFLKWNFKSSYQGMFDAEAKGLKFLHKQNAIKTPAVVFLGDAGNDAFLILEYIETVPYTNTFWKVFGIQLAALHKTTSPAFGLDHDNYIGSLPQSNRIHNNWSSFFIEERLEPQIKLAREKGAITKGAMIRFESLYKKLDEIFPFEPPALIHGDLWNGNFIATMEEKAGIFDPAIYFGHREMDLAMSKLFGGFDQQFYTSYNSHFPLHKGWESRTDICNLYPLMVHVNLFGGSYLNQVEMILKKF